MSLPAIPCCPICLESFESFVDISALRCGHTFHLDCLANWAGVCADKEQPGSCPTCKKEFDAELGSDVVGRLIFAFDDSPRRAKSHPRDVDKLESALVERQGEIRVLREELNRRNTLNQDLREMFRKECAEQEAVRKVNDDLRKDLQEAERKNAELSKEIENGKKGHKIGGLKRESGKEDLKRALDASHGVNETQRQYVKALEEQRDELSRQVELLSINKDGKKITWAPSTVKPVGSAKAGKYDRANAEERPCRPREQPERQLGAEAPSGNRTSQRGQKKIGKAAADRSLKSGEMREGRMFVKNLDYEVSDADIQELFSEFGRWSLTSGRILRDKSGKSLGAAEVVYRDSRDAEKAIKKYNGVPLDGRRMFITMKDF